MKLRRGITGFWYVGDPPLPSADVASFHSHCHLAAQRLGGRVVGKKRKAAHAEMNFEWVEVRLPGAAVVVLLNRVYPVLAFIPPVGELGPAPPLTFVDCESLATRLAELGGYEIARPGELGRAVGPDDLQPLARTEVDQAEYWKPVRVGDVVFNFWD